MILPIHIYGLDILRKQTREVTENTPELQNLIDDMIETMRNAAGIGLAAPQVGRSERLFVVDLEPMVDDPEIDTNGIPPQPMILINPEIIGEGDMESEFEEGCLSIPDIRENVWRPESIRIRFRDRNFELCEIDARAMLARVFQHEFDHLNGVLFVDHISPFRRRLFRRRLRDMAAGVVDAEYPVVTAATEETA